MAIIFLQSFSITLLQCTHLSTTSDHSISSSFSRDSITGLHHTAHSTSWGLRLFLFHVDTNFPQLRCLSHIQNKVLIRYREMNTVFKRLCFHYQSSLLIIFVIEGNLFPLVCVYKIEGCIVYFSSSLMSLLPSTATLDLLTDSSSRALLPVSCHGYHSERVEKCAPVARHQGSQV